VWFIYASVLISLWLSALDSNDTCYSVEGEIFEYQGDDQEQAEQGKPSKLVAYLIPVLLIA
jgi:hypothetical protein